MTVEPDREERSFDAFVRVDGERLRRVMAARYGVDIGCDAADSALAWGWERWHTVGGMDNPAGYLYRVAQTHAQRAMKRGAVIALPRESAGSLEPIESSEPSLVNVDLVDALHSLPERQRMVVVLVHVYGWTPTEVAELTGTPAVTVRSQLRRALRHLHRQLEKGSDR